MLIAKSGVWLEFEKLKSQRIVVTYKTQSPGHACINLRAFMKGREMQAFFLRIKARKNEADRK
jgi:hypothetical protein